MIILKLGGSVITRKEEDTPTVNYENLQRISKEIADSTKKKLVIVHGAGSFGHPYARKYSIGDEIKDAEDQKRKMQGFSITHHAVNELNSIVCSHLRKEDLPIIPLQPSSFILTHNKRIQSGDINLITKYLEMDFIPVLYGDVVLDTGPNKMAVLSGDQIITYLAGKLQPERVILATDVDGIYDKNPKKYPEARLLETVTSKEDIKTGEETNIDVTGGMGGKVNELLNLLKLGIESEIINANCQGNIKKILTGEKVTGTTIKKPEHP